jgi:hypothetical protein
MKVFAAFVFFAFVAAAQAPPELGVPGKNAGEVFKNIQTMKDDPSTSIQSSMQFMSEALGVECRFCHTDKFDEDTKNPKKTARKMIEMERMINKASFEGRTQVTCYTCHQGHSRVVGVPQIPLPAAPAGMTPLQRGATAPSPDDVFNKYVTALGGAEKVAAVKTRVLKGSATGLGPAPLPLEMRLSDGKMSLEMGPPNMKFVGAYNGKDAWLHVGPQDAASDAIKAMFEREAELYPAARLKGKTAGLRVVASAQVNGQDTWVLTPAQRTNSRDQYYFAKDSGLLLRQTYLVPTLLGPIPAQMDYDDYRDSGGSKVAFKVKISQPTRAFTFEFASAEPNAAVAESAFEAPKQ